MKIYGTCKRCEKELSFWSSTKTRVEFAMKYGDSKKLKCNECQKNNEFQVDELFAKESRMAMFISVFMLLIGTPLVFYTVLIFLPVTKGIYVIGGFLFAPVYAYIMINKHEQTRVDDFNRNKLKS